MFTRYKEKAITDYTKTKHSTRLGNTRLLVVVATMIFSFASCQTTSVEESLENAANEVGDFLDKGVTAIADFLSDKQIDDSTESDLPSTSKAGGLSALRHAHDPEKAIDTSAYRDLPLDKRVRSARREIAQNVLSISISGLCYRGE